MSYEEEVKFVLDEPSDKRRNNVICYAFATFPYLSFVVGSSKSFVVIYDVVGQRCEEGG